MKYRIFPILGILCLASLLLFAACDYDDLFYNTPHPTQGALLVHTGCTDAYYLKVQDYCTPVSEADFRCPQVFAPDACTLSVFNLPAGMERADNLVSVIILPDGTLTPQPGELRGNITDITPVADDTLSVDLPLKQLTRRLTLKMKLRGGNVGIVAKTEARITGIAPALDISTLKLQGEPAIVCPLFVRYGDMLTAELNLIGVSADVKQRFTIIITTTDGQQQILVRDMTGVLSAFNQGTEPMVLDATLELMDDIVFDADITDWKQGGDDEADAV